jgi:HK97 family phage major capsid protein
MSTTHENRSIPLMDMERLIWRALRDMLAPSEEFEEDLPYWIYDVLPTERVVIVRERSTLQLWRVPWTPNADDTITVMPREEWIRVTQEYTPVAQPAQPDTPPAPARSLRLPAVEPVKMLKETDDAIIIRGRGVVFGDYDLYGETFTKDTDFMRHLVPEPLVMYGHGIDGTPDWPIGKVTKMETDDYGLWVTAQLDKSEQYTRYIQELIEKGVLGWSSGSVAHLVRYADDQRTIKQWPIVEFSLTPRPAEPRTLGVEYVRAWQEEENADMTTNDLATRVAALEQAQRAAPAPRGEGGILTPSPEGTSDEERHRSFRFYVLKGAKPLRDLQEDVGTEGGVLVPNTYSISIIAPLTENSVMRRVGATVVPLEGTAAQKVPTMAHSGAAQLTREEHDYSIDAPSLGEVELRPYKYTRITKASEELLDDSRIDVLAQVIAPDAGRAFAQAENAAFLTGGGGSEPQGILSGLDSSYSVTSEASTAIKYTDVVDVFYKLPLSYRDRARWLVSDDASKALRKLQDGAGRPIWETSVQAGQPDLLLGRPVVTSSYLPTVATGNITMVFGDFSYFWIAEFGSMAVQRLDQLFAANGQIGFRWYRRMDSRVMLGEAFASLKMK